jgi:hypothetical protein
MSRVLVIFDSTTLLAKDRLVWAGDQKTFNLLSNRRAPDIVIGIDASEHIILGKTIYDKNTNTYSTPPDEIPEEKLLDAIDTVKFQRAYTIEVTINGVVIPVQNRSPQDLLNLEALKVMGELGEGCAFRDADNKTHDLTADQIVDLYSQVIATHLAYVQKRSEIRALVKDGTLKTYDAIRNEELWKLA